MSIEARVVLDSINPTGQRLTTFLLRYPKFVHGELMTHRVFSRNASSSRAIPVRVNLIEAGDPMLMAKPVWWGAEQKGMASGEELSDEPILQDENLWPWTNTKYSHRKRAQMLWENAAHNAVSTAAMLSEMGVHKSIVNRVMEPFLHINVLVSATEYMNFFGLRLDKAAQPEIRALAEKMWAAYGESKPRLLQPGQWHLPFLEEADIAGPLLDAHAALMKRLPDGADLIDLARKVSTARCARLSYMSFETGKRSTVAEDLALYDKLVGAQPLHASPAEHVATPDEWVFNPVHDYHHWKNDAQHGNFVGWRQFRKMLPGEACAPLPEGYR